jgi:hypothetical protein
MPPASILLCPRWAIGSRRATAGCRPVSQSPIIGREEPVNLHPNLRIIGGEEPGCIIKIGSRPEALIDLGTLQELRRLSLGDTAVIGPFEVTIREAAVRQNQVEVSLHLQPLTPAELEQRKQFNPFFLSVGGDRGTWVSLVIWRAGSGTFAVVGPEGALCGADIQSDGQQPLRLQCRFRVPADAAPAYLLLSAGKAAVTFFFPFIPFESLEHRAVIPLTPLPPALVGNAPDLPVPLGQPVRTPDGVEITVLDSTATSEPLPVGNETGSITLLGAGEGQEWRVVRLRLQCGRPDRCALSLGAFRVQRSDGSSSPPALLGPPPYRSLSPDELILSWQGQETLEFAFSAPASWPREMKDLPFPWASQSRSSREWRSPCWTPGRPPNPCRSSARPVSCPLEPRVGMAHREAAASVQPPGSLHHLDPVVPGAAKRRGVLPSGVLRLLTGVLGTAALPTALMSPF